MRIPGTGSALGIYLNDHLAGATGGSELAGRIARSHADSPQAAVLDQLAREVVEDRTTLLEVMAALRVPVRRYKVTAGWAAEKLGRFKLNGHLLDRSPLADLIELEALQMGVHGKADMWLTLRAIADRHEQLDTDQLDQLIDRAAAQLRTLEQLHRSTATQALTA
jgi:hypothetical protein